MNRFRILSKEFDYESYSKIQFRYYVGEFETQNKSNTRFDELGNPESSRSTMNMQVEEFYNGAKDADYIIYNSSIDGGVTSIDELLDKCALLKDFKAVKEGNVWCTTNDMYQQSMSIGYLIADIHAMLQGAGEEEMEYLFRLE